MPETRRLVFHIGLEKTGTSSLQACLHRHDKILRRHSVLYPKRNRAYGWENHKPLVGCYGIEEVGDKWLEGDPSRRKATLASLIGEIEAAGRRTAIISAEHFSSRFQDAQVEALHADFRQFDCRVIIVIRDHMSRLCSAYASYVTNGGEMYIDDFAEQMIDPARPQMRYAELVASWARVFGRDRILLIAYGPDVVSQVLSAISPGLGSEPSLPTYHLRRSARPDVVAALRLANEAARHGLETRTAWVRHNLQRAQVRAWLQRSLTDAPSRPWSFEGPLLERLANIICNDRAELAANHGFVVEASEIVSAPGFLEREAAELLARALVGRAAEPWGRARITGVGLAAGLMLRDKAALIRRWPRRRLA